MDLKLFFALLLAPIAIAVGPETSAGPSVNVESAITQSMEKIVTVALNCDLDKYIKIIIVCESDKKHKACEYVRPYDCTLGVEMMKHCPVSFGNEDNIKDWVDRIEESLKPTHKNSPRIRASFCLGLPYGQQESKVGKRTDAVPPNREVILKAVSLEHIKDNGEEHGRILETIEKIVHEKQAEESRK